MTFDEFSGKWQGAFGGRPLPDHLRPISKGVWLAATLNAVQDFSRKVGDVCIAACTDGASRRSVVKVAVELLQHLCEIELEMTRLVPGLADGQEGVEQNPDKVE